MQKIGNKESSDQPAKSIASASKYAAKEIFNSDQEKELASYIEKCSNLHYGLTLVQTRRLAYQYAKKLELNYPPTWETKKEAGVDWSEKF